MAKLFGLSDTDLNVKAKKYDLSARKYIQYQEYKKAFYNKQNGLHKELKNSL